MTQDLAHFGNVLARKRTLEHSGLRFAKWLMIQLNRRPSRTLRYHLWEQADGRCRYCGRPVELYRAVLDHAVPQSRGGTDGPSNRVLSCRACDIAKGNRTIAEWKTALLAALFTLAVPDGMGSAKTIATRSVDGGLLDSLRKMDRADVARLLTELLTK